MTANGSTGPLEGASSRSDPNLPRARESEMVRIVATEEQIRQLMESKESVEFVDTCGNRIGVLSRNADHGCLAENRPQRCR